MKRFAAILSAVLALATLFGACSADTPAETTSVTAAQAQATDSTAADTSAAASDEGEIPAFPLLIVNNEPFTVTAADGFDNRGFTAYRCDATADYSFVGEDGTWSIYLLEEPFDDAVRYLKSAHSADLAGNGILNIKEGTYIYIECSYNAFTCDAAPDEDLEIRYADLDGLSGEYTDSFSQRAVATVIDVTDEDDETELYIKIHWGSSATESTVWEMECEDNGNGRFTYDDCKRYDITTDDSESGESSKTLTYQDGEGYFTLKDGKLLWNGAAEEDCRACVFEK